MITIQNVTTKVRSVPRQSPDIIDKPNCVLEERVRYSTPSVTLNSNYVITVSDLNCLKYFCVFLYYNHQVHRDFLITLYNSIFEKCTSF
jgi:hypothetical protein